MKIARAHFHRCVCASRARGFTLVEVSVSVVIVAVMLVTVLQTVSQANLFQFRINERSRGQQLARMLMVEILQQAYVDPGASPLFGPETGETRATYEDVDDYNGMSESPLTNKDGTAINLPVPSTWQRTVTVAWVDPTTLAAVSPQVETGVKKITVTVLHRGYTVTTLSALRSNAP